MAQSSRTFRIFVSSTFSDMKEERNALQKYVFPRLRDLAMSHGCRFQAIDLRWGVSEEAALDQQTMKICLTEIERCQKVSPRPNFIILLGDRFGWRPLPYAIPVNEFEKIVPLISPNYQNKLCWQENQPDGEKGWYRLDENAVPAEYVLQPRKRGMQFEDYEIWEREVERPLVSALERAVLDAGLDEDDLVKYTYSATGQEIVNGALKVRDAHGHVFGFFRSITNPEEIPDSVEGKPLIEADSRYQQRQRELKILLKQRLPGNIHEYTAQWLESSLSTAHIGTLPENLDDCLKWKDSGNAPKNLCEAVWLRLSQVILAESGKLEAEDALGREQEAHYKFCYERARFFEGREELLSRIADYLVSADMRPFVVWGESGSGKSALLAKIVNEVQVKPGNPAALVVRFIGATPESCDGRSLLESLCRQITRAYNGDESSIPVEYHDLVQEFPKRLALATEAKPLILFLDALDQLSERDNAHNLVWLPGELPPDVKFVVSTLPGDCLDALQRRLPNPSLVKVTALSRINGENLLQRWLDESHRALTVEQRTEILKKFLGCGGLPLYLKLAFEETRHWHGYDGLLALSDREPGLSEDIPGIIRGLFWGLEQDSNHGQVLASSALGYLAAAKNGLSEDELLDVLWADPAVQSDFFRRSPKSPHEIGFLPVVIWSRLYLDLEPYLAWRQADGTELLSFYHRQMREVVEERYAGPAVRTVFHRRLAAYFGDSRRSFWLDAQQRQPDRRKTAEMAYQQSCGGLAAELSDTLSTFDFLYARLVASGVEALIEDYDLSAGVEGLRLVQGSLRLSAHILAQDPAQLPSQIFGRLQWFDQAEIRRLLESTSLFNRFWLRSLAPCLAAPGDVELRTFTGHTGSVNAVAVMADGRRALSASSDCTLKLWDLETGVELRTFNGHNSAVKAVAVLADNEHAISASEDCTLKLWDLETGKEIRTFTGHTSKVSAVALLAGDKRVLSASEDRTLKLWDLDTGEVIRTFTGHKDWVSAVAVLMDGKRAISACGDHTLKLWDLETGEVIRTFAVHQAAVSAVAVLADGKYAISGVYSGPLTMWDLETGQAIQKFIKRRIFRERTPIVDHAVVILADGKRAISASSDKTLSLWDLETGVEIRTFAGHTGGVKAVAVLPDGRRAISASADQTLKLWDLDSVITQRIFNGHSSDVHAVTMLTDGKRAISASQDTTLKLWDIGTGAELRTLIGHKYWAIMAVAVMADGKRAISGCADNTLSLWDLETGKELSTFKGHHSAVNGVAVLENGKRAISASTDTKLKLWNLETGKVIRTFTNHIIWGVEAVAVLPDGRRAISASLNNKLKLWNLDTGKVIRTFSGHMEKVNAVAVLPDGKYVISASFDHTLKLWDIETGKAIRTFSGHKNWVSGVAVLPGGQCTFASVSYDHTLKLWNINTGECLCTYFADTPLTACTAASNRDFIAGDSLGRMHFLHLEGSQPSGPLKSNQSAPPIAELQAKPAWLSFLGRMVSKLTRGRL